MKPLRQVLKAKLRVATSLYASFKFRFWDLTLDCGHEVERPVRHTPGSKYRGFAAMHQGRPFNEVLPVPKRVRCEYCPEVKNSEG